MGQELSKTADDIKSGAEAVGGVVRQGLNDVTKASEIVQHGILTVGDKAAHIVENVPVVGGALGETITGASHLLASDVGNWGDAAYAIGHPKETLHAIENAVTHPGAFARRSLKHVSEYAQNMGKATTIVAPEISGMASKATLATGMGAALLGASGFFDIRGRRQLSREAHEIANIIVAALARYEGEKTIGITLFCGKGAFATPVYSAVFAMEGDHRRKRGRENLMDAARKLVTDAEDLGIEAKVVFEY